MHRKRSEPVSLDVLASQKLPPSILEAIAAMELTLGELALLEANRPNLHLVATDECVLINIRIKVSAKVALCIFSGLGGLGGIWFAFHNVIAQHFI